MFRLNTYLNDLISECRSCFTDRLLYVGLQGSYLRGEENEHSDIDIMLILDRLTVDDMNAYRSILNRIGYYEKSCGFICGRDEIMRWNPLEVCQLKHTTRDLFGTLSDYLPNASRDDEILYVRLSLGNLYHAFCHHFIHADQPKSIEHIRHFSKGMFFLIQNLYYLESGTFAVSKKELKELVSREDREVLMLEDVRNEDNLDQIYRTAFDWLQHAFRRIDSIKEK